MILHWDFYKVLINWCLAPHLEQKRPPYPKWLTKQLNHCWNIFWNSPPNLMVLRFFDIFVITKAIVRNSQFFNKFLMSRFFKDAPEACIKQKLKFWKTTLHSLVSQVTPRRRTGRVHKPYYTQKLLRNYIVMNKIQFVAKYIELKSLSFNFIVRL